jgi:hypothetical protein
MNPSKLAVLSMLALALVVGIMLFGGSKTRAAGPVCSVPGDYPTIQAAVNDAGCTTINVGPGVYNENVSINRSLTLNGAQQGVAFSGRTFGSASESKVTSSTPGTPVIKINATNVTVDGFSVTDVVASFAAIGIDVKSTCNGAVIANNIIDGISTPDLTGNGTAQAIYLEAGPDNVQILANQMNNVHSNRSAKGVTIGDSNSTNPSVNILIDGNSISNVTSDTRGAYGVSINNGNGATANSGLVIRNNSIFTLNGGGWVHAVGLEANTPGVLVRDNSFSNLISPSTDAVAVWFEVNPSFPTAQVNTNNFNVGPTVYGIAVGVAGTGAVDGTCNWWGAPNGPGPVGTGAGAKVSPKVNYSPWSTSPEPSGDCNGAVATAKDQCKDGGWQALFRANGTGFKNQGDCIQYINTGK